MSTTVSTKTRRFQSSLLAVADNLRLALGTFLGNPLRSLLTLLGIVIGVMTVITMMALIEGLRLKVNKDLSQLGANTPGRKCASTRSGSAGRKRGVGSSDLSSRVVSRCR